MRRPGRIFQADVDIEAGCFYTKKGRNSGSLNNSGYRLINLKFKNEKCHAVMTLHFAIFCEANNVKELPKGYCLHHIDNRPDLNNGIDNLALCTPSYNNFCAAKNRDYNGIYQKRKENGFIQKIVATAKNKELTFKSQSEAARFFSVNVSRISRIVNNKKYHGSIMKDGLAYDFCRA